jgi:hypothetical protein
MHTLLFPLVGLPLAIGLVYFYKDLRKVKSWSIKPDPLVQPTANSLEAVTYVDLPHGDGPAVEAIEAGVEAIEAGAEALGEGIGLLLENAGHFWHH